MRVVALCANVRKALRFSAELESIPDIETYYLICNNRGDPRTGFRLRQILRVVKNTPELLPDVARLLATGRVKFFDVSVHDERVIEWIESKDADIGIHGMGVIYREHLIESFSRGILNTSHIGRLPDYRGRSVFEWTLLFGERPAITTFFIDTGIDTGSPMVSREEIDIGEFETLSAAKQHLFGQDARLAQEAIRKLQTESELKPNHVSEGRRSYVMSDLFSEVAADIFQQEYALSDRPSTETADPR